MKVSLPILFLLLASCTPEKYTDDPENCTLYTAKTYDVEHATFFSESGSYQIQITQLEEECPVRVFLTDDLLMAQADGAKATLTFDFDKEAAVLNVPTDYKISYVSPDTQVPTAPAEVNSPQPSQSSGGSTTVVVAPSHDSFWVPFMLGSMMNSSNRTVTHTHTYYYPPPRVAGSSSIISGVGASGPTREAARKSYTSTYKSEPTKKPLTVKKKSSFFYSSTTKKKKYPTTTTDSTPSPSKKSTTSYSSSPKPSKKSSSSSKKSSGRKK